jgi:release factor glutamine methyltransferase
VWATDRSADALAVARANLAGVSGRAATRVRLAEGSWFDALPPMLKGQFDLIVSNPPYIAEREIADLDPQVVQWEPRDALVAGATGLEDIEVIIESAPAWLTRPGALVVEIAPSQAQTVQGLAYEAGFTAAEVLPDLLGRARVLVARV